MQEVVDLPGLVGDPEIEALVLHDVVEDHEVRAEDLVEAAQHLEGVELVLAGLGVDVSRLGCELGTGRVDALALRLEHRRHRVLGEPLDLETGVQLRNSRAIAMSRQTWPSPIGEQTRSARRPRFAARAGCRGAARRPRARRTPG